MSQRRSTQWVKAMGEATHLGLSPVTHRGSGGSFVCPPRGGLVSGRWVP